MLSSICAIRRCIFAGVKFFVAIVHRFELAAVNGDESFRKQLQLVAQYDELAAHLADRGPIVLAEVGNGLEVWHQPSGQPHELDIALRLALQPAAGLDAIQVAVDVELQQHRRVVRRPACRCRVNANEAKCLQIKSFDEDLDHANRILRFNVVLQTRGQQAHLGSVLAFDESLHAAAPNKLDASV